MQDLWHSDGDSLHWLGWLKVKLMTSCGFFPQGSAGVAWPLRSKFLADLVLEQEYLAIPCGLHCMLGFNSEESHASRTQNLSAGFYYTGQQNCHITPSQEAENKLYHKCWCDSSATWICSKIWLENCLLSSESVLHTCLLSALGSGFFHVIPY